MRAAIRSCDLFNAMDVPSTAIRDLGASLMNFFVTDNAQTSCQLDATAVGEASGGTQGASEKNMTKSAINVEGWHLVLAVFSVLAGAYLFAWDSHKALLSGMTGLRTDLLSQMGNLRTDVNSEMGSLRKDLQSEMGSLRKDLQSEMGSLRKDLQSEMGSLRTDLNSDIGSLRTDLRDDRKSADDELKKLIATLRIEREADRREAMVDGAALKEELARIRETQSATLEVLKRFN